METTTIVLSCVVVLIILYAYYTFGYKGCKLACGVRLDSYCNGPFCMQSLHCSSCATAGESYGNLVGAGTSIEQIAQKHPAFKGNMPTLISGEVNAYSHQMGLSPIGSASINKPIPATIENLARLERAAAGPGGAGWYVIRAKLDNTHHKKGSSPAWWPAVDNQDSFTPGCTSCRTLPNAPLASEARIESDTLNILNGGGQ